MKFAHSFTEELQNNSFPREWQNSAIRYRQLKKCIKKVQRELAELGLTADMLKMLATEKHGDGINGSGNINDIWGGVGNTVVAVHARQSQPLTAIEEDLATEKEKANKAQEEMSSESTGEKIEDKGQEGPEARLTVMRRRRGSAGSSRSDGESSGISLDAEVDECYLHQHEHGEDFVERGVEVEMAPHEAPEADFGKGDGSGLTAHKKKITFSYWFDGTLQSFMPKLVLTVDSEDGIPLDLGLAPETRKALEELVLRQQHGQTDAAQTKEVQSDKIEHEGNKASDEAVASDWEDEWVAVSGKGIHDQHVIPPKSPRKGNRRKRRFSRTIQVPLSADAEFFRILTSEITSIEVLQTAEERKLTNRVSALGSRVTDVAKPKSFTHRQHSDLYSWREIFRIYVDSGIFFSQRERDGRGQRTVEKAEEKLHWFKEEVGRLKLTKQFRNKQSAALWEEFMALNAAILRLLRFQEINKTAMRKILKKFDKRTSLNALQIYPTFLTTMTPFLSPTLAKALCYTMHTRLLTTIPQLDDYLCPICSSISVKPVRLSCSHVFCVRCLVKLQREKKRYCPCCRGDVVMEADEGNLDLSLLRFLKEYFPKEAKEKQAENEKEVTLEQFRYLQGQPVSVLLRNGQGCVVM